MISHPALMIRTWRSGTSVKSFSPDGEFEVGIHRLVTIVPLDRALLTALLERWRQETHTFHLPVGEVTVTLSPWGCDCIERVNYRSMGEQLHRLLLMRASIFRDKSGNEVQVLHLPMLERFDVATYFSWGSATLAYLLRQLCRGC
ncbi:unnamed protein product [Cuscuta europaea]|uniref:Aminotransferase-like plant mobile domain-containing protein n=1 Tax=Cuscuta europaea TaxID=41803 RepID=A0A9P1EF27_CUSEU|nr:unnamed protein product [Cuscuta europaea]